MEGSTAALATSVAVPAPDGVGRYPAAQIVNMLAVCASAESTPHHTTAGLPTKPRLKDLRGLKESFSQHWMICLNKHVVESMASASQFKENPDSNLHTRFDAVSFFNALNMGVDGLASMTVPSSSSYMPAGADPGDVVVCVCFKTHRGESMIKAKLHAGFCKAVVRLTQSFYKKNMFFVEQAKQGNVWYAYGFPYVHDAVMSTAASEEAKKTKQAPKAAKRTRVDKLPKGGLVEGSKGGKSSGSSSRKVHSSSSSENADDSDNDEAVSWEDDDDDEDDEDENDTDDNRNRKKFQKIANNYKCWLEQPDNLSTLVAHCIAEKDAELLEAGMTTCQFCPQDVQV
jgi:hypothetical protein